MTNPEPIIEQTNPQKEPDTRTNPAPVPQPTPAPTVENPKVGNDDSNKDIRDMIAAIPERIVDAIRESSPPKNEAPAATTQPANPTATNLAPGEKPKGRSFAEKWFGIG